MKPRYRWIERRKRWELWMEGICPGGWLYSPLVLYPFALDNGGW